MKLPYTIKVVHDNNNEDPGWVAQVAELPGCLTQADTFEELGEMIEDAMRGWLTVALKEGLPIPEPQPDEDYSGKFVLRLPRSLHRQIAEMAQREGVSLNQYVNVALARAVGAASAISVSYAAGEKLPQLALREKKED
ncbi:MAG: type II toxin-antitoxin system HicB family antitoxin [Anaerolineales bacterium]